jgi:hypothetical protein
MMIVKARDVVIPVTLIDAEGEAEADAVAVTD